ncbi:SCO3242 family prenyltransferase [Lentzea sp. NPDC060358]|uniref:SCO3242 family prenyltransferase n=1 Tax=Lentzea sp. NPDC060358 TaxID=3347103 RepID=UPI003658641D
MKPVAELVRAPAALTVLGDTVAGSATAGLPLRGRRLVLPLASAAFYWAGMALNDWADRELDADERPERPIPSGRVRPAQALGVAAVLTGAGLGLSVLGGGRGAVRTAVPLAGAIWAYDLVAKSTPAGPAVMALCRGLDVLLGSGSRAWPAAAVIAGHTFGLTTLSRGEVHGATGTQTATALTTTVAAAVASIRPRTVPWSLAYLATTGPGQLAARHNPTGPRVRAATRAGIHAMIPLQAAITARTAPTTAAVLSALLPVARRLSRRVSPT